MGTKKPDRQETTDWANKHNIRWLEVLYGEKKTVVDNWSDPIVYEAFQDKAKDSFLTNKTNLGFICDHGGLVVLDGDNKKTCEMLRRYLGDPHVVTASGKYHWYLKSEKRYKTFRIHEGKCELDFQAIGAYVMAPASIIVENGKYYRFVNKRPPIIWDGDLEYDVRRWIANTFDISDHKSEDVDVGNLLEGVQEGLRDITAIKLATFFRTEGRSKKETFVILNGWNKRNQPPMENADLWLDQKINSAWRHDKPYGWRFINTEFFSEEEKKIGEDLLDHPEKIVPYILEATAEVVDEDANKVVILMLIFVKGTGQEVSGGSGWGKNNLVNAVVLLLPLHWVEKASGISPKALRHGKKYYRCIYIDERRGLDTGAEGSLELDLKMFLSRGEITIWIAQKNEKTGKFEQQRQTVKCDAFVSTTTDLTPPSELANRMWNLSIDESLPHRRRVIKFMNEQVGLPTRLKAANITAPKKRIMRYVFGKLDKIQKEYKVMNPIAKTYDNLFPEENAGIYRHVDKFNKLVEAFTYVYHRKVPTVEDGGEVFLITSPEVIKQVVEVAEKTVIEQIYNISKRQKTAYNKMRKVLEEDAALEGMRMIDVAAKIGENRESVKGWVRIFEERGLIESWMVGREKFIKLSIVKQDLTDKKAKLNWSAAETAYSDCLKKYNKSGVKKRGSSA